MDVADSARFSTVACQHNRYINGQEGLQSELLAHLLDMVGGREVRILSW
jgi:hypothetical protein